MEYSRRVSLDAAGFEQETGDGFSSDADGENIVQSRNDRVLRRRRRQLRRQVEKLVFINIKLQNLL